MFSGSLHVSQASLQDTLNLDAGFCKAEAGFRPVSFGDGESQKDQLLCSACNFVTAVRAKLN